MPLLHKLFILMLIAFPLGAAPAPHTTPFFSHVIRAMCNSFFYLIASSNASDETTTYVTDLMAKLAPHQKITAVRKFNAFGEYLFGRHNTIAVPFVNYLILNTRSLKKFPEEIQRFVIGRSLYHMAHAKQYLMYTNILPLLCNIYIQLSEQNNTEKETAALAQLAPSELFGKIFANNTSLRDSLRPLWDQTQGAAQIAWKSILARTFFILLTAHTHRSLEQVADTETAHALNCVQGGITFLKYYQHFYHDGSPLGQISAFFPFFEGINYAAFKLAMKYIPQHMNHNPAISVHGVTIARLQGNSFIAQLKNAMPGQIAPFSNVLEHSFWRLPFVHYFSHTPLTKERIKGLKELGKPQNDQPKVS